MLDGRVNVPGSIFGGHWNGDEGKLITLCWCSGP